jgi:hypothetical protein
VGQPVAFANSRRTSLTLAAETLSSRAVSRTPRPSSSAARMRSILNGVVLRLPRRLPDDPRAIQSRQNAIADHRPLELAEHPLHPEQGATTGSAGIERLLVQVEIDVAGS